MEKIEKTILFFLSIYCICHLAGYIIDGNEYGVIRWIAGSVGCFIALMIMIYISSHEDEEDNKEGEK